MLSNFTAWMETQRQTNGDAIPVGGQKLVLDNSIDRDWMTLLKKKGREAQYSFGVQFLEGIKMVKLTE